MVSYVSYSDFGGVIGFRPPTLKKAKNSCKPSGELKLDSKFTRRDLKYASLFQVIDTI
jgi:hypothetical protein